MKPQQPLNEKLFQIVMNLPDEIINWSLDDLSDETFPLYLLKSRSKQDKANGIANAIVGMKPVTALSFLADVLIKVMSQRAALQPNARVNNPHSNMKTIDNGPHPGEQLAGKF